MITSGRLLGGEELLAERGLAPCALAHRLERRPIDGVALPLRQVPRQHRVVCIPRQLAIRRGHLLLESRLVRLPLLHEPS